MVFKKHPNPNGKFGFKAIFKKTASSLPPFQPKVDSIDLQSNIIACGTKSSALSPIYGS
jgi:hypothetical protein